MKKGQCDICGNQCGDIWTLVLAQYDSLRFEQSTRLTLCVDCAGKMSGALQAVKAKTEEDSPVIICPNCRERVRTQEPKVARPCPRCSTIFSAYSAWKRGNSADGTEGECATGRLCGERKWSGKRVVGDKK
ncbi:MAG: hypothetical protein KGZ93_11365 [Actinobacteria bacterium]|nr:hypothetical protein [Actinomycetota bacterium]